MTCQNYVLDEDGERVCECGDEGRMCAGCEAAEAAYWKALWVVTPADERDPERYEQEMREAGRGHLLPPND
jgi:hypothetical protein